MLCAAHEGLLGRLSSAAEALESVCPPSTATHARSRAAQCCPGSVVTIHVRLRKKKPRRVAGVQTAVAVTTGACPGRKSREQMLEVDGSAVLEWICQEVVANPTGR